MRISFPASGTSTALQTQTPSAQSTGLFQALLACVTKNDVSVGDAVISMPANSDATEQRRGMTTNSGAKQELESRLHSEKGNADTEALSTVSARQAVTAKPSNTAGLQAVEQESTLGPVAVSTTVNTFVALASSGVTAQTQATVPCNTFRAPLTSTSTSVSIPSGLRHSSTLKPLALRGTVDIEKDSSSAARKSSARSYSNTSEYRAASKDAADPTTQGTSTTEAAPPENQLSTPGITETTSKAVPSSVPVGGTVVGPAAVAEVQSVVYVAVAGSNIAVAPETSTTNMGGSDDYVNGIAKNTAAVVGTSLGNVEVSQATDSMQKEVANKSNVSNSSGDVSSHVSGVKAEELRETIFRAPIPQAANAMASSALAGIKQATTPIKQIDVTAAPAAASDHGTVTPANVAAATDISSGNTLQFSAAVNSLPLDLPITTREAADGNAMPSSGAMTGNKDASSTPSVKFSDVSSSASSGSDDGAGAATTSHDAASHGAQSAGQSQKDPSQDSAQVASVARPGDNGALQQPAPVQLTVSHDSAASHPASTNTGSALHTGEARVATASIHTENLETSPTSTIDSAKVLQTMSASEMRVGMHSSEFGNISIRTTISQQQMVAQISVDHSDLSHAISSHLASVQSRLGTEHGLNASIEINSQGASSATDSGQSSPRQQLEASIANQGRGTVDAAEQGRTAEAALATNIDNGNRLDIRA